MIEHVIDLVVSVCLFPILCIVSLIFVIYRQIISAILSAKWGDKYAGLLNSADSLFLVKETSRFMIVIAAIIRSKKKQNVLEILKEKAKKKIFDHPDDYTKITSICDTFCGVPYYIKNEKSFEDCISSMDVPENEPFDENYVKKLVERLSNSPLPRSDKVLVEAIISEKPLDSSSDEEGFLYPFILRCNHALGDGTSLMALALSILQDENGENYSVELFDKLFGSYKKMDLISKIKYFLNYYFNYTLLMLYVFFIGPSKCARIHQLRKHDVNAIHGPKLSGDKNFVWFTEESAEFIPIVKRIKNRVPNAKFLNVIVTAIAASLTDYFKRNSLPVPDYISAAKTVLLDFPQLDSSKPVVLNNKTSLEVLEVPMNNSGSVLATLQQVQINSEKLKLGDAMMARLLMRWVIGLLPLNMAPLLMGNGPYTCLITNIPGGGLIKLSEDMVVEKIIPVAPNAQKVGLSITMLSYDNRFQFGLMSDKAILADRKELQKITDDIFFYIKKLDEVTRKVYE